MGIIKQWEVLALSELAESSQPVRLPAIAVKLQQNYQTVVNKISVWEAAGIVKKIPRAKGRNYTLYQINKEKLQEMEAAINVGN